MRALWIAALLIAFHVNPIHANALSPATVVATMVAAEESGYISAEWGTMLREIVAACRDARSIEEAANALLHLYFWARCKPRETECPFHATSFGKRRRCS